MIILGAIVLLLALALYAGTVATLADLHGSDPAGNALAPVNVLPGFAHRRRSSTRVHLKSVAEGPAK